MEHYPFATVLFIIAIILVFTFFITSADSATYVLVVISEKGKLNLQKKIKIIWGILLAVIAMILLLASGLGALQNVLIIVAFHFAIILMLILISSLKELHHEQHMMGLKQKLDNYPSKNQSFRLYED